MSVPPFNALRAFEAVARLGSFKAAGDALFVTQSAISHQIRSFEDWLGAPLFTREGNRTRILPHATELARTLSRSLAEIDAACHHARKGGDRQDLVIAAIPSVAMCWLIPHLSRFQATYPEIETRVLYAMHGRDINFHDVHLAFVFAPEPPKIQNVDSHFFLSGASSPVCSPTLLERLGHRPETRADFIRLGLLHDGDTCGWNIWFQGLGREVQPELSGSTFEDFNLLRAAVLSGQGVALCPVAMVQPDIESGSLVRLSDHEVSLGADYYLLALASSGPQISRQVRLFREWAMSVK